MHPRDPVGRLPTDERFGMSDNGSAALDPVSMRDTHRQNAKRCLHRKTDKRLEIHPSDWRTKQSVRGHPAKYVHSHHQLLPHCRPSDRANLHPIHRIGLALWQSPRSVRASVPQPTSPVYEMCRAYVCVSRCVGLLAAPRKRSTNVHRHDHRNLG